MENLKQESILSVPSSMETRDITAENRRFLLDLNKQKIPLWTDNIAAFMQIEFTKCPELEAEYKNFRTYENYPAENIYYFLLEKYGLLLYTPKTAYENLITPIVSSVEASPQSYNLWKHFPVSSAFTENIRLYAINDKNILKYWNTKTFLSRGKFSQTIVINLETIRASVTDFYGKVYGGTNFDFVTDNVIVHELTHAYYTNPNHKRIMSIDWSPLGIKDPVSILEFLAEFSELMNDPRVIAYWLDCFIKKMRITEDGKLKTLFEWPQFFIYNQAYEAISTVFARKGLSLDQMMLSGVKMTQTPELPIYQRMLSSPNNTDTVRSIVEKLTPEDIAFVQQHFLKLQKTIVDKIEKAPK